LNQKELHTLLKAIGYPVAFFAFENPPALPYLVYLDTTSGDLMADNRNYVGVTPWQVELYTAINMPTGERLAAERRVEGALSEAELPYVRSRQRIDAEKMYQTLYIIQTIGG